jgi:Ca2+-binding EF-hand superfamily protein
LRILWFLQEALKKKIAPDEIFDFFDDDGSDLIGYDEFRILLPAMGIDIY